MLLFLRASQTINKKNKKQNYKSQKIINIKRKWKQVSKKY